MKTIEAILLNYTTRRALQKALDSLLFLSTSIVKAHVISGTIPPQEVKRLHHPFSIEYIELQDSDLGAALNKLTPTLSSEFVMFLYDQDFLAGDIEDAHLMLNEKQSVITHMYQVQDVSWYRPFLVKVSCLKQSPSFFTREQVPFADAVLPSWLSQLDESEVVSLNAQVVKQVSKTRRTNDRFVADSVKSFLPISSARQDCLGIPSLSVLMPTYNMGRYIQTAIASLATQSESANQILLIDDGSTDETQQKLMNWKHLNNLELLRIENSGKARALNYLLAAIRSEFVMELDADDWLDPNAIATIRNCIRGLPAEVHLLYGNLRIWKERSTGELWCKGIQTGRQVQEPDELLSYPLPLGPRIYRTSTLLEVGGFPVTHFEDGRLYEDVLVLRNLLKNGRIQYHDFTVYNVREHSNSVTKRNSQKWGEFKNMLNRSLDG